MIDVVGYWICVTAMVAPVPIFLFFLTVDSTIKRAVNHSRYYTSDLPSGALKLHRISRSFWNCEALVIPIAVLGALQAAVLLAVLITTGIEGTSFAFAMTRFINQAATTLAPVCGYATVLIVPFLVTRIGAYILVKMMDFNRALSRSDK